MVVHQILQSNSYGLKWLKKASEELDKAVDNLKNVLFKQTIQEPQTIFKTREVYELIRSQYSTLKQEGYDLFAQKIQLQRKIISPERAMAMAKNIFVQGDFKRLREQLRRYKKDEQTFAQKLLAQRKKEEKFQKEDWSLCPRSSFLQQQYYLTKQRTLLEIEQARLEQSRASLQNKQNELETLCRQPEAIKKIDEIAVGILRKNLKFVQQLEEVKKREAQLTERMEHLHDQLDALKIRLDRDSYFIRYKVVYQNASKTNDSIASLIADAILMEPQAVQLVARFNGNNLEMDKNWELMSELDKDEFLRKKIIREL